MGAWPALRLPWLIESVLIVMATQLRLERHQIEDLEAIRELGPETLRAIVHQLGELDPAPCRTAIPRIGRVACCPTCHDSNRSFL